MSVREYTKCSPFINLRVETTRAFNAVNRPQADVGMLSLTGSGPSQCELSLNALDHMSQLAFLEGAVLFVAEDPYLFLLLGMDGMCA